MKGILNLNNGFGAMLNKFGQCILLSMYWVVFSLPIFTWGAAGCALYSTGRKLLENEEGKLFQTWKSSFKQNFKQGAAVGSLALLVLLVAFYSGLLMLRMGMFSDTLGSIAGIVYLLFFDGKHPTEEPYGKNDTALVMRADGTAPGQGDSPADGRDAFDCTEMDGAGTDNGQRETAD